MEKCSACGAPLENGRCSYCGANYQTQRQPQQPQQQYVPPVQQQVFRTQVFVNQPQVYEKPKSRVVAFLLCFFLGFFGAHKFYLGRPGAGILYIFTMGLFGFGWMIDMFLILFTKVTDSRGIPIQ